MSTTYSQDQDFKKTVISDGLLDDAIAWIAKNLSPQDVFPESELAEWADENGYVKEGE